MEASFRIYFKLTYNMKTELYYKKRAIVERIVMLIENKKQLAESL